jgi:hypothetical protein
MPETAVMPSAAPLLPPSGWGFWAVLLLVLAINLAVYVGFAYLLVMLLKYVPRQFRRLDERQVWYSALPVVGVGWLFFVMRRMARSFQAYFNSVGDLAVGDCGWQVGLMVCICLAVALVASFLHALVAWLAFLSGLALAGVYLSIAFRLKRRIPGTHRL